jgi:hypothetical protein
LRGNEVLLGVEPPQRVGDHLQALGWLEPAVDDDPVATPDATQAADPLNEAGHGLVGDVDIELTGEALELRKLFLGIHDGFRLVSGAELCPKRPHEPSARTA